MTNRAQANNREEHERFGRTVMETEAGTSIFFRLPACTECHAEERIRVVRNLPPEAFAGVMRKRGWRVGKTDLVCPACVAKPPVPKPIPTPPVLQEVPKMPIPNPVSAPPAAPTVAAAPPPPASPADRKKVREALYEHYDEDKARYRQSWSDKALGAKLQVPWAWVAEIREALGFGPDQCEAADLRAAELAAVRSELADLADDFVRRSAALEARIRKLEIDAAYGRP